MDTIQLPTSVTAFYDCSLNLKQCATNAQLFIEGEVPEKLDTYACQVTAISSSENFKTGLFVVCNGTKKPIPVRTVESTKKNEAERDLSE